MKKAMLIINPTSGGEKALDYKEKLENKAKEYLNILKRRLLKKLKMLLLLRKKLQRRIMKR